MFSIFQRFGIVSCFVCFLFVFLSRPGDSSAVSRRAGGGLPPVHGPQCFWMFVVFDRGMYSWFLIAAFGQLWELLDMADFSH